MSNFTHHNKQPTSQPLKSYEVFTSSIDSMEGSWTCIWFLFISSLQAFGLLVRYVKHLFKARFVKTQGPKSRALKVQKTMQTMLHIFLLQVESWQNINATWIPLLSNTQKTPFSTLQHSNICEPHVSSIDKFYNKGRTNLSCVIITC
jgi:hypothetical protein